MHDLIYLDNRSDYQKAQDELKQKFPSAIFEDGSDGIHDNRFAIKLDDILDKDYYIGLLDLGLALHSLNFHLFLHMKTKEAKELINEWRITKGSTGTTASAHE